MAVWVAGHRKGIASFVSVLLTQISALLALGILNGQTAHNVALAIEAASPLLTWLGVHYSPPNTA